MTSKCSRDVNNRGRGRKYVRGHDGHAEGRRLKQEEGEERDREGAEESGVVELIFIVRDTANNLCKFLQGRRLSVRDALSERRARKSAK